jgi:hypothetical protein
MRVQADLQQPRSIRVKNLAQFTIVLFFLVDMALYWSTKHIPASRILFSGVCAAGLVYVAVQMIRKPSIRLVLPKVIWPLAALALLGFVSLIRSPMPYYAWERATDQALLISTFIFVVLSMQLGWRPETWERALIGFAVLLLVMELMSAVAWIRGWYAINPAAVGQVPPYRLSGFLLQSSTITAGYFSLMLPLAYSKLVGARRWPRSPWLFLTLGLLVALLLSASRGAYLSATAGLFVFLAALFLDRWKGLSELKAYAPGQSKQDSLGGLRSAGSGRPSWFAHTRPAPGDRADV